MKLESCVHSCGRDVSVDSTQVALVVKNLPASAEDKETQVRSLGQEDSLEEEMAPTPVFLPGESHGQRNLVGYSP